VLSNTFGAESAEAVAAAFYQNAGVDSSLILGSIFDAGVFNGDLQ
jgi:hypothetical protein